MTDFNYRILDETAHRTWPIPSGPWIMTQTWHDLLFAHWRVDAALLASKIPPAFDLDLFDGQAWLGIVPFHMTNVAPRLLPAVPWLSAFPELNVRTYVRVGNRPGVYFFSLDASNPLAVVAARTMFHLPYYTASMTVEQQDGAIRYSSRRAKKGDAAALVVSYRPVGPVFQAPDGTLDHFLTERYCLFTVDREQRALTVDIHHPPWPLQAADATFTLNTIANPAGIDLPAEAPLLHFARRQDMEAWPLRRVAARTHS